MKKLYNRTALFHARAIVGLFALCLLALPSPALAQAIDLKLTNVTVKEAIEALNQRENYSVAIKSAGVDMQRRVSISAQNASIDEVLAQIFADQDISYTITGKSISVTKAAPKSLAADKNQLKGVVKDNLGLPVPGATIIVDGTNNGTTTMSNGDFSLENVKLPAKLVISFIGYQPRTVDVNSYAAIDITLVESSAAIDEVVVVGYGQQKRVNVTGAVGTISGKDLNNRPVTNTAAALQGADPSLLLTLGSGSIEAQELRRQDPRRGIAQQRQPAGARRRHRSVAGAGQPQRHRIGIGAQGRFGLLDLRRQGFGRRGAHHHQER